MDVEHLFDGQSLVFYFLGPHDPRLETITAELAEVYEAKVQFRSFADAVNVGCGPGCGTSEAIGGGCGTSCSTGRSSRRWPRRAACSRPGGTSTTMRVRTGRWGIRRRRRSRPSVPRRTRGDGFDRG
jgi:hypothetical protein